MEVKMQLSKKVRRLKSTKGSAVYLLQASDGYTLIDTGFFTAGQGIVNELINLQIYSISKILLTHHDPDHIGNMSLLQRKYNCPVYINSLDIPYIQGETSRTHTKAIFDYFIKTDTSATISSLENTFFDDIKVITEDDLQYLNESPIFKKTGLKLYFDKSIPNHQANHLQKFIQYITAQDTNNTPKNKILEFTCSSLSSPMSLYHDEDGYETDYRGYTTGRFEEEDNYYVISGNIYRKNFIDDFDYENTSGRKVMSIYDVIESIGSSRDKISVCYFTGSTVDSKKTYFSDFKKAYNRERHGFGTLGRLSANRFFWLSMVLGKVTLL